MWFYQIIVLIIKSYSCTKFKNNYSPSQCMSNIITMIIALMYIWVPFYIAFPEKRHKLKRKKKKFHSFAKHSASPEAIKKIKMLFGKENAKILFKAAACSFVDWIERLHFNELIKRVQILASWNTFAFAKSIRTLSLSHTHKWYALCFFPEYLKASSCIYFQNENAGCIYTGKA